MEKQTVFIPTDCPTEQEVFKEAEFIYNVMSSSSNEDDVSQAKTAKLMFIAGAWFARKFEKLPVQGNIDRIIPDSVVEIEDGFGGIWSKVCSKCKKETMQIVRPGKVQCSKCG